MIVRLQFVRSEGEVDELKTQIHESEEEKSLLQDQLDQRIQSLEAQDQKLTSLVMEKDEAIERLKGELGQSSCDLNAVPGKAGHLQELLDAQTVQTDHLQDELSQLRQELESKDANNDELEDDRFDAEVALANNRRAFESIQRDLIERSRNADARSLHKGNLLSEVLAQMAKDRQEYHLTLSTKPDADFLLLRLVAFEGSRICLHDRVLSLKGADELLEQLELVNHDIG